MPTPTAAIDLKWDSATLGIKLDPYGIEPEIVTGVSPYAQSIGLTIQGSENTRALLNEHDEHEIDYQMRLLGEELEKKHEHIQLASFTYTRDGDKFSLTMTIDLQPNQPLTLYFEDILNPDTQTASF